MNQEKFSQFNEVVTALDEIRAVMGEPLPPVLAKVIDHVDDLCRDFIAKSPFVIIATAGADGHLDLSPKGDPAGFVQVLDDKHVAIPDRPGNRRADTFRNLLEKPQIGLLFMIPGKSETLRVGGEARIVRDRALRESMTASDHIPEFVIVIHVEWAFFHCPKCLIRSQLWWPNAWSDASRVADIGEAMVEHAQLAISPEQLAIIAENEGLTKLY